MQGSNSIGNNLTGNKITPPAEQQNNTETETPAITPMPISTNNKPISSITDKLDDPVSTTPTPTLEPTPTTKPTSTPIPELMLNVEKFYLYIDEDKGPNSFDLDCNYESPDLYYYWESANEEVAVVDKNGVVTATGIGHAFIFLDIENNEGFVKRLCASAVVIEELDENLEEGVLYVSRVEITNPPSYVIPVDTYYDFDCKTINVAKAQFAWKVSPDEGAAISSDGIFIADKPGMYVITAMAFYEYEHYMEYIETGEEKIA